MDLLFPRIRGDEIGFKQQEVVRGIPQHLVCEMDIAASGIEGPPPTVISPSVARTRGELDTRCTFENDPAGTPGTDADRDQLTVSGGTSRRWSVDRLEQRV